MEYFAVFDGALQGFLGAYAMGHGLLAGCVQLLARWRNRLFRARAGEYFAKVAQLIGYFVVTRNLLYATVLPSYYAI